MKKRVYIVLLFFAIIASGVLYYTQSTNDHYAQKTDEALRIANESISSVKMTTKETDTKTVQSLLETYKENISSSLENAGKITDTDEAKEALVRIFKSVSSQLASLRTMKMRLPLDDVIAIDQARDTNVKIQEQAVKRLSAFLKKDPENGAGGEKSNTASALSCPDCSVIILSLTTLRKDHMGIYGYDKETTPHIDNFFRNGLVFNNTLAPTSWTAPDVVSLYTSLFPYSHGIMDRVETPLYNRKVATLAEVLKQDGYQTAAFTGGGDYNNLYTGLRRGFDYYLDEDNFGEVGVDGTTPLGSATLLYAPLRSFLPLGISWLGEHSQNKFFLMLQGYDTHCPLDPREPFAQKFTVGLESNQDFSSCHWTHEDTAPAYDERGEKYWDVTVPSKQQGGVATKSKLFQNDIDYMNALYDGRISEVDFYLADLFGKIKDLGLEKNTIVILMSDHGEMLGEHGRFMRGGSTKGTSYQPALSFPLLMKHPKVDAPLVINDLVQTVDIMPTVLSLLGVHDSQQSIREGNALRFSAFGDSPVNEYVFAASSFTPYIDNQFFYRPTASESIRDTTWKLIKETVFTENGFGIDTVSYKLFNLDNDPNEETDLYETEEAVASRLKVALEKWLERYR